MKRIRIARSKNGFRQLSRKIQGTRGLLNVFASFYEQQRRIELENSKIAKMEQDRRIGEMELEIKSDRVVLLDIQIEAKKLELLALKRKLGNPDEFAPEMTRRGG